MKIKHIYFISFTLLAILLVSTAFTTAEGDTKVSANKEIIKFSHQKHAEVGDCESCHAGVKEAENLEVRLLPEKETCAGCHDVEDEQSCNVCHYDDVYEPLVQKKSELIFNHKLHSENPDLTCESCHKGIAEADYAIESGEAFPAMAACYTCHNNITVADNNCETCHKSTVNLIPENHKKVSFFDNHKFVAMSQNQDCTMCHDNNFCETCHVSTTMITEGNTETDFYVPYSPHNLSASTMPKILKVHDPNYVFTHGIDLKGKNSECQSCHQVETFCAECHNSRSADYLYEGVVPSSHRALNWMNIAVGSGGGEHGRLAKRDIERCASCHDVQGADPNCMVCHADPDGIAGTNAKTHVRGYMRDVRGDWHDDAGSVCFACHTNASPGGIAGQGFCGYCHTSN